MNPLTISDLDFNFPAELIATYPINPCRVLWHLIGDPQSQEISFSSLLQQFQPGDVLVINDTQVVQRRIFAGDLEILFLNSIGIRDTGLDVIQVKAPNQTQNEIQNKTESWEVLFPAQKYKIGQSFPLPSPSGKTITATLRQKGRPQILDISEKLTKDYFDQFGEIPLPPYIQEMRASRHADAKDKAWYQTAWSKVPGSLASPTASLHFAQSDLQTLRERGVHIHEVTLHVGLGTFLPLTPEMIAQNKLHSELSYIPQTTWKAILEARRQGDSVWALGTTVTRTLESAALGILQQRPNGDWWGSTDLFISPGFRWQVVDKLMTNFHFPKTSLLALVAAFVSLEEVKKAYQFAIERRFRLFSYGDLSVWVR